jgi:hypothetical protein
MDRVVDSISEDDLPDKTLDKFQKLVTIDIASSPNGEAFSPDSDELIEVLYDFDTSKGQKHNMYYGWTKISPLS